MTRGTRLARRLACWFLCSTVLAVCVVNTEAGTRARSRGAITKPTYDPTAEKVELFAAMEEKTLEVKVIPKDEFGGNILIENKTDKPLTVQMPESFVGVPVLKQFGGGQTGLGGGGAGGFGGQGGQGGQNQSFGGGGGLGGGGGFGGGGLGGLGGGGGFFSVPPEKTVRITYNSVCLNHGLAEPRPSKEYRLVPTEEYTQDVRLQQLVNMVATGRLNRQAAQAAAWHLTDDMSWQELAAKSVRRLGGAGSTPYFNRYELTGAMSIMAQADALAREAGKKAETQPVSRTEEPVRRGIRRVAPRSN